MVRVTALDHVVVNCTDVETSLAWYTGALGLAPVRVGLGPFAEHALGVAERLEARLAVVGADATRPDPTERKLRHRDVEHRPVHRDATRARPPDHAIPHRSRAGEYVERQRLVVAVD